MVRTIELNLSMATFFENDPTLQNYWRAIILYGQNVASYKFALAKAALIDLKKKPNDLVLGADSVIDLGGELISKPTNRSEAFSILEKLNGKKHQLISSVCISKNGSMIWNFTDSSSLTMKKLNLDEIKSYLAKIKDKELYAYGVYQIEADGRSLFAKIEGDEDTIMGLPVKKIKEYLKSLK